MFHGLTHLSVHGWVQAWGRPHLWGLEGLQSVLQGTLVTRNPSRPGLWVFPALGAPAPTFPCSLICCCTSTRPPGPLGFSSRVVQGLRSCLPLGQSPCCELRLSGLPSQLCS